MRTIDLSNCNTPIGATKLMWASVAPDLDPEQIRVWCDHGFEVNPANGRWAVEMRERIPMETIWEYKGIFFTFNEAEGLIHP